MLSRLLVTIALANAFGAPIQAERSGLESHTKICTDVLLEAKTRDDFKKIGHLECLKFMRRGDADRVIYQLMEPKCTHKRIKNISKSAERLHNEAKKRNPDPDKLDKYAEDIRNNYRGRSSMYKKCYKAMARAIDTSVTASVPVG